MKLASKLVFVFVLAIGVAAASPTPADLLLAGRIDDALTILNARVQSFPSDAEAYHLLSRAYYDLKKWDQAITNGEKAVQLSPGKSEYYLWLGRSYGEKAESSNFMTAAGLVKKIRGNFEKAVELDSNNIAARSDLAEFYIEAPGFMGGGTDKAADQARHIAPLDTARAHWVNARIAEKKKDYAAAEREYTVAIKAGQDADNWLNLASFYRNQNRWSDMDNAISKAMSANMKQTNALYDAATLLYQAGRNLPTAANLMRKYLMSVPNEEAPVFEAHYMLGQILEKQGDRKGAASEYRMTLTLARSYWPAHEALKRVSE